MIGFTLGVEDLADTRFALSPLHETLLSLRVLQDPGLSALHLPWRNSVLGRLGALDTELLMSLVAQRRTLPDFLTPPPTRFAPTFEEQLAVAQRTLPAQVHHDLALAHAPDPLPPALHGATDVADAEAVAGLRDTVCELVRHYWHVAIEPMWPQMRLVLEADMTYRARQLAVGGARRLFADMHPNLCWGGGVLHVDKLVGSRRVSDSGGGLLLLPSIFAHKPVPPVSPDEPPVLVYPSRGVATLWAAMPTADTAALASLLGRPRARLLDLLREPLPTVEIARRLRITPSAASQHLRILHATGLVTRARDGRHVHYRRSALGDQLMVGSNSAEAQPGDRARSA